MSAIVQKLNIKVIICFIIVFIDIGVATGHVALIMLSYEKVQNIPVDCQQQNLF